MGQYHFLHLLNHTYHIVNAPPVPARFQHHLAWTLQCFEKLSESMDAVPANAAPRQLPPSLVYCNKHTVALVNIHSNIVHAVLLSLWFALYSTAPELLS